MEAVHGWGCVVMPAILPLLAAAAVFGVGDWLGRHAEHLASVAELVRMAGERDQAVRLAQECQAHMAQIQAVALLAEVDGPVLVVGPMGDA